MHFAVLRVLVALSFLGIASAQNQADVAYLTDGVREIAPGNYNGSLIVIGDGAFPVINAPSPAGPTWLGPAGPSATEPLVAAARLGKGRVVVFGNTAVLEDGVLQVADTTRLTNNILRWAAGEKASPRVGVYNIDGLARQLKSVGVDARDIELRDRTRVDIVMVLARFLGNADVDTLLDYVREGGGLVTGAVGWISEARHPDQDFPSGFPGNRLIAPAGLLWGRSQFSLAGRQSFRIEPPPELSHSARALAALESNIAGQRSLSARQMAQISTALMRAVADLPHTDTMFLPDLNRLAAPAKARSIPTADQPIRRDDLPARLAIALEVKQMPWTAPEHVRPHPAAAAFPGSVPQDAPRVKADVRVETSGGRWGWFGTGLYAAPGEVITVRVPDKVVEEKLSIVIGAHTDKVWDMAEWQRVPEISFRTPIAKTETRAANAFGGPIYISVPEDRRLNDFDVTIAGGVPAPRYVYGKTNLDEWRRSIRHRPAPWAEIESDKIILTVPSDLAREVDDPDEVMKMWNQVSDLETDFAGHPHRRARPERLVPDLQPRTPTAHNGYPCMGHMRWARAMVRRDLQDLNQEPHPQFGTYHELAHNLENYDWIFDAVEESPVNMFVLYVFEKFWGVPVASNPRSSQEYRVSEMRHYNFAHPDYEEWKNDSLLNRVMYIELQQAFGWDAYKSVFAQYLALPANQRPRTNAEKRDQWMVRFSRQVHRNLGPFFRAWGVPTSGAARASIADLPVWMPEELEQLVPAHR